MKGRGAPGGCRGIASQTPARCWSLPFRSGKEGGSGGRESEVNGKGGKVRRMSGLKMGSSECGKERRKEGRKGERKREEKKVEKGECKTGEERPWDGRGKGRKERREKKKRGKVQEEIYIVHVPKTH